VKKLGKQLLISVGLLSGLCAPALAQSPLQQMMQPKAASGDAATLGVPGQPNFYESTVSKICPAANPCTVLLDAVPAGRTLAATNLNCAASYSGSPPPEQQILFGLLQHENTKGFFTVTGKNFFAVNEQIRVYFPQRARPKVQVLSLSAPLSTMVYTLTGTLLK
jgi:hypothetical protein